MDEYEATKTVMSRIQTLDPHNASKIMGYILIQDQADKEMIRLAFSPDAILLSYINRAKARFGFTSNPPSPTPFPQIPPTIFIPTNNGATAFHLTRPSSVPYASNASASPGFHFYGGEFQLSDSLLFPYGEDAGPDPNPFHKRSCSVNDAAFLEEGAGALWRPCMYFARGVCKNGGACNFLHGQDGDPGSPGDNISGFEEVMRMKALQLQQQRLAAIGAHHPLAYNRGMDFMNEKNLRLKPDRGDLAPLGLSAIANSVARQIYLTFPADSTFKEEDVSNYFGMFGPVQDVRIPYQQKRMFGFVTFVYPETVNLILAKGNPHFVCDSRVLVKPYKEKGKFKEKKYPQQCLSPSGLDGDPLDTPFGPRMLLSPRELMLRRKLEQEAEMQHAIELEGRRMMNLQLMDLNNENHNYRYLQSLPAGIQYSSPLNSHFALNRHFTSSSDTINQENLEEFDGVQDSSVGAAEKKVPERTDFFGNNMDGGNNSDETVVHESLLEHNLPDNLFTSPTKSAAENHGGFLEADNGSLQISSSSSTKDPLLPGSSPLTIASLKSCYLQMPRFSSGQEGIEM